jgi:uncharacterized flavoprotein (TIGR03862 family)
MTDQPQSVAIIGSGPAALMAADVISSAGIRVSIFEKRKSPGRKLLVAGSSGLNITNNLSSSEFAKHYTGFSLSFWNQLLQEFSPQDWIQFIENLGIRTFEGTSGRYFVEDMKASKFLRAWLNRLAKNEVKFFYDHECVDFSLDLKTNQLAIQFFQRAETYTADALCFCLGGGSYETKEVPLRWPPIFKNKGLKFEEFTPSNVGFQVKWTEPFLKEAEGLPLKNIQLISSKGSRKGDLVITNYGLEGTPVYFGGEIGTVHIDLKPDLRVDQILAKCRAVKENLSPIRRVSKQLNLCPASLALLFHMAPQPALKDIELLAQTIKNFPISFHGTQSLSESISSQGGLHFSELEAQSFMLNKVRGVFAAGEMLNWDAPTGGFLIQACVSQGFHAGKGILNYLNLSRQKSVD